MSGLEGISGNNNLNKLSDNTDVDKNKEKEKKLLAEIKDLIKSSGSLTELKGKIDMLKQIAPEVGKAAEDLLNKLESSASKSDPTMGDSEKLEKMKKMLDDVSNIAEAMAGSAGVTTNPLDFNNDALRKALEEKDGQKHQISVSI